MAKKQEYTQAQINNLSAKYQDTVFKNQNPLPSPLNEIVVKKGCERNGKKYDIVYNFNQLFNYQHNSAMAAFRQIETLEKNDTPSFAEQARVIVHGIRDLAFAFMLMEKHKSDSGYTYIPCLKKGVTQTDLLDDFRTEQTMLLLHEVQPDFFYKHGIQQSQAVELVKTLMQNMNDTNIGQLSELMQAMTGSSIDEKLQE